MDKRRLVKGEDGLFYDEEGRFVYTGLSPLHEDENEDEVDEDEVGKDGRAPGNERHDGD